MCLIIEGMTNDGKKFRPSDWIDRMCSLCGHWERGRYIYSTSVRPIYINGVMSLRIDDSLKQQDEQLYLFLVQFAESNNLKVYTKEDNNELS